MNKKHYVTIKKDYYENEYFGLTGYLTGNKDDYTKEVKFPEKKFPVQIIMSALRFG